MPITFQFNIKEKLAISAILTVLYLIPASIEWAQYEQFDLGIVARSLPIWLVCFYVGPFWLFYALQKIGLVARLSVVPQGVAFVALMFAGATLVYHLHQLFFPDYQFAWPERLLSAFLWGVFIFAMTHLYLLYGRYVNEKRLRKEAQWADLTSRLNPHFLFNSLNTISALIHQSPDQADDVLHKLADILRYSVDQQSRSVSLEQELAVCQTYLSIEQARFGDNLQVDWQLEEGLATENYQVPPLLLQPLIENVMKHVKRRPILLRIGITKEQSQAQEQLVFTVEDNGQGFKTSVLEGKSSQGQGLNLVNQRVGLVGGALLLTNSTPSRSPSNQAPEPGGAVCTITLPI
ncbi:MAG TPA: ATPase [Idiomarina abyssalis]|jgi:two-component sensor histidine kinase|uniref:sensor histidine kinase n=1 Tax=Idiomarinaceae TaxID=267893 RepID=UPI000C46AC94|nr:MULTISPECIES: histidine kinase [Idiomarinaceae]MAB21613.1 ATPase [Idiomarina sp.]MBH93711.1 ATPase [Idiomarina sp.]HAS14923.1 ATPase [Idiomarina abyssalis]|tara:strand:- start:18954 stop:19997 length:1044 start_codon:yes stop_codon:yes gene_type:complete